MGFRQIYIEGEVKISLKDGNILFEKESKSFTLPIDDIDIIFIENSRSIVTARIISECCKKDISIVFCNEKFLPASICHSLYSSNNQIELFYLQFEQLQSKKDKLWEYIIRSKIQNHAEVVRRYFNSQIDAIPFYEYAKNIKSGDKTFIEGAEARFYFRKLFGNDFIRHAEDSINYALNYGYQIINGAIIRSLVAAGLDTKLGIHHFNKKNFYNLASDFLEPYRAFVDLYVITNLEKIVDPLPKEVRMELINLLNLDVKINDTKTSLSNSIKIMIYSFIDYLNTGEIKDIKLVKFYE